MLLPLICSDISITNINKINSNMRKLLLFFAMLSVSIGAWGAPGDDQLFTLGVDTWFGTEYVATISLKQAGALSTALSRIEDKDGNGPQTEGEFVIVGQGENSVKVYLAPTVPENAPGAETKAACKHIYISTAEGVTLSDDDISALNNLLAYVTIDLQDAISGAAFTFANSGVKNLILPDGWTKAEVKACAQAVGSNLGSAYSQNVLSDSEAELVVYVNKSGSLRDAMDHCFIDNKANNKIGSGINRYDQQFTKIKYVSLMGNVAARDFNGAKNNKYDPDGHFVFNVPADETSTTGNAGIGGVTRELLGTPMAGALVGANLITLDLEDALITDAHCDDLNLSWSNVIANDTKVINIPTTSDLTILPADFLNLTAKSFEEICIPGNIQVIRTRALYISDSNLRHIWTTGTKTLAEGEVDHTVYDNGAYILGGDSHTGHAALDDTNWNKESTSPVRYGTITLPPNLTLIESHAVKSDYISDVYSLSVTAPECHVDAFSSVMYMGNNTIRGDVNGMITRESYAVSTDEAKYIAFLHYPRESTTPDIQRYTDVTREYSVATTLRDGKGNVIYFPNQSELNRAYYQGQTGYLWYAWNSHRTPESWGNANSFDQAMIEGEGGFSHTNANQTKANDLYIANSYTDPDKTDRSFYDVRLDATEQPSFAKPSDLKWYYNTEWEGKQLYPQMETTQTQTPIGQVQKQDSEGHLLFIPGDCDFVQDYKFVKQDDGELVWVINVMEDPNGAKVKDYEFVRGTEGILYYKPLVSRNNDGNKPKPWYSKTQQQIADPNGNYIWTNTIGDQYNYTECSTWLTWNHTEAELAEKRETGWTFSIKEVWAEDQYNGTHYISENYVLYSDGATDIAEGINDALYNKIYKETYREYNASADAGETRYNVDDQGLKPWDTSYEGQGYDRYHKQYIEYAYREFDSSKDSSDEPRYCRDMEDVYAVTKDKQYDYRGWHQFILTAYATNDDRPITPIKFYQTDNDWWTVCFPYDLRYSEMKKFFGDGDKIPYLSKLRYVVRDYDKEKITLMFSKNLMEYKEVITNPTIEDDYVHGVIDDETKWPATENGVALGTPPTNEEGTNGYDPIILHKGVPYLIKPNIAVGANRQFDVYQTETPELYKRLIDVQYLDAGALETMIYKGEYTVPAYVIGNGENTVDSRDFEYQAGPTFSYSSDRQITYGGQKVSARISSEFSYTFVGSFFLSVMPKDCYFLGWDSKKNCAAFWFNKTPKLDSYDWNNQTGIICPNFKTNTRIHEATGLSDPARWIFEASTLANDNLKTSSNTGNAKSYGMDWGGSVDVVVSGIGKINVDNAQNNVVNNDVIYDMRGVRMNRPLSRLTKGVYIVNGKKYVVD